MARRAGLCPFELYLAVVIDAYSRKAVGWSTTEGSPRGMAEHLQAELVIKALEMAVWNRRPSPGLIHHSDQRTGPGGWNFAPLRCAVLSKTRRHSALNYDTPWAILIGAANPRIAA